MYQRGPRTGRGRSAQRATSQQQVSKQLRRPKRTFALVAAAPARVSPSAGPLEEEAHSPVARAASEEAARTAVAAFFSIVLSLALRRLRLHFEPLR